GAVEVRPELGREARALVDRVGATGELRRLLEIRVPELCAYQNAAYADEYVEFVRRVREVEAAAVGGETRLSEGVARYLFKLMAYKDEYEVARLHLAQDLATALAAEFPGGVTVQYNLHPPLLRALGMTRKLKLGKWFDGVFRLLVEPFAELELPRHAEGAQERRVEVVLHRHAARELGRQGRREVLCEVQARHLVLVLVGHELE